MDKFQQKLLDNPAVSALVGQPTAYESQWLSGNALERGQYLSNSDPTVAQYLANDEARRHDDFMANTSYRRAAEDLQAAGYSPLALLKMSGADSPGMTAASVSETENAKTNSRKAEASKILSIVSAVFKGVGIMLDVAETAASK